MGSRRRRRSDRAMREPMHSPGRPTAGRREYRARFWENIARGLTSEQAAIAAGVSQAVGTRWFRECGGMPPFGLHPLSGRYLSFVEREEIAILQAGGRSIREIAAHLGRSPSTITRQLRRNASTRSGGLEYRATTAQWHADRRAKRPKVSKLSANCRLREYVQDRLGGLITPQTGRPSLVQMYLGSGGVAVPANPVDGPLHGVPSRSPTGYRSIFPTTRPCGSPTKRSTRRSSFKGAVDCVGS
jgi:transposase